MNQVPKFNGIRVAQPDIEIKSNRVPPWVKCKVCGKPPIGTDWLKPVNPDPHCREFVHLSHIQNGPGVSLEGDWYLRNA